MIKLVVPAIFAVVVIGVVMFVVTSQSQQQQTVSEPTPQDTESTVLPPSPLPSEPDRSDWLTYNTQQFAYTIQFPPAYTVQDVITGGVSSVDGAQRPLDNQTAQFISPVLNDQGNVVITIMWDANLLHSDFKEYSDMLEEQNMLTRNGQRLDMIYPSDQKENLNEADAIIPVNNGEYVIGVITDTPIGPRGSSLSLFQFEKKQYVIQIESTAGSYDEMKNEVEPILSTLELTPDTARMQNEE